MVWLRCTYGDQHAKVRAAGHDRVADRVRVSALTRIQGRRCRRRQHMHAQVPGLGWPRCHSPLCSTDNAARSWHPPLHPSLCSAVYWESFVSTLLSSAPPVCRQTELLSRLSLPPSFKSNAAPWLSRMQPVCDAAPWLSRMCHLVANPLRPARPCKPVSSDRIPC